MYLLAGLAVDYGERFRTFAVERIGAYARKPWISAPQREGICPVLSEAGHDRLIRVDYHGPKEVPTGTCHAILKAAGIKPGVNDD
jgi:hypothetical protein